MKKLIALLLAFVMLVSLVACNTEKPVETQPKETQGSNKPAETQPKETEPTTPPEPVKITIYPLSAGTMSGEVGGWLGEYLLEEHGLIVEFLAHDADKLAALIASEELPDMMYIPASYGAKLELAESGLIKDLEPYLDQMPHIAENATLMTAVDYARQYVTDGTLNMIPLQVGPVAYGTNTSSAIRLNWEVYEQIGAPEFNTLEELIPILKQMQAAYPQSPSGEKTYAMHLYTGSDTSYFYGIAGYYFVNGYHLDFLKYGVEANGVNETFNYIMNDNSAYKAGLKYYNTLYREGLLDPNSINVDSATQKAKIADGGAVATWNAIQGDAGNGYYPVYYKNYAATIATGGWPYGSGHYMVVSEKTENLDACLRFLDMAADPECARILFNGPQGELWDYDANGNVILTEKGTALWVKGEAVFVGDQQYAAFNTAWVLHPNYLHADGECVNIPSGKLYQDTMNNSEGQAKWAEHYGYPNIRVMIEEKGNTAIKYGDIATKFAAATDDDQNLIIAAAKDIIVNASWKLVYAESDADFEAIWAQAVKDCEELGFKAIYEWRVAELNKGFEIVDSLAG